MKVSSFLVFCLGLSLVKDSLGSKVASSQYNHDHGGYPNLKCYTCFSIEGKQNSSNVGCTKDKPSSNYLTSECFGYSNSDAGAAVRHSHTLGQGSQAPDPYNVHCVNIKGKLDAGNEVVMKGCIILQSGEVYDKMTCVQERDIPFPPHGLIRNVEYCYCKGDGCNGSSQLGMNAFLLIGVVTLFAFVK